MIKEVGKIISIKELDGDKIVTIECISKSACSSCNNQNSCGVGTVAKSHSSKTHHFEMPYTEGMKVDEAIELQIKNSDLVGSAIIAYLIPLTFFLSGAVTAKQLGTLNEVGIILIAAISAAVGFVFARFLSHKFFPIKQDHKIITTHLIK